MGYRAEVDGTGQEIAGGSWGPTRGGGRTAASRLGHGTNVPGLPVAALADRTSDSHAREPRLPRQHGVRTPRAARALAMPVSVATPGRRVPVSGCNLLFPGRGWKLLPSLSIKAKILANSNYRSGTRARDLRQRHLGGAISRAWRGGACWRLPRMQPAPASRRQAPALRSSFLHRTRR
jgi:hypothetical protein